jgi:hypothetical protein
VLSHAATPTAGTHLRGTDAGHRVKHKCFTAVSQACANLSECEVTFYPEGNSVNLFFQDPA